MHSIINRFVSIILLVAFTTVNFSKLVIWTNYEINKAEITQKYCINKDKPGMHCCGKCLLKRKLAEDEARKNSPAMPDIKNEILLFNSAVTIMVSANEDYKTIISSPYNAIKALNNPGGIFHPPCC